MTESGVRHGGSLQSSRGALYLFGGVGRKKETDKRAVTPAARKCTASGRRSSQIKSNS